MRRVKKKRPPKELSEKWITAGAEGALVKAREKMGLGGKDEQMPIVNRTKTGSDAELSGQRAEFERRWRHMRKFFLLIGDYASALLVDRDQCPVRPHPLSPVSVCAYVSYMSKPKGTVVVNPLNSKPILDRNKQKIYSFGLWNAPVAIQKFQAATTGLHDLYQHLRLKHVPACQECIRLTKANSGRARYTGCDIHTKGAQLVPTGNPLLDRDVGNFLKGTKLDLSRTYRTRGNVQLTPLEVRQLRQTLLVEAGGQNQVTALEGLKEYTMILLGIKLFLRSEELIEMKVEDFVVDLTKVYPDEGIKSLVVVVQGKTDKHPVHLVLRMDIEHPEFCPVRHLLLYLYLMNIRRGYLFPPYGHGRVESGEALESYAYDDFLNRMKSLCKDKLMRTDERNIYGTHILRKTAYLFAVWGVLRVQTVPVGGELDKLSMASIMKSARHVSLQNAAVYAKDSITLFDWCEDSSSRDNMQVSVWRDIHIEVTDPFRASIMECRALQKPLYKLSAWYYEIFSGLGNPTASGKTPSSIEGALQVMLKSRLNSHKNGDAIMAEFCNKLKEASLPTKTRDDFMSMLEAMQKAYKLQPPPSVKMGLQDLYVEQKGDPGEGQQVSEENNDTKTGGHKRKYGSDDLPARKKLKDVPISTRVDRIARIAVTIGNEEHQTRPCELTNAARKWFYAVAKPLYNCLHTCHSGSQENFHAALMEEGGKNNLLKRYRCTKCCN